MEGSLYYFRANPSYCKSGKSLHDWANIDWDLDSDEAADVIPSRLIVYIQLDDFLVDPNHSSPDYFFIDSIGTYAIVESLIESSLLIHQPNASNTTILLTTLIIPPAI